MVRNGPKSWYTNQGFKLSKKVFQKKRIWTVRKVHHKVCSNMSTRYSKIRCLITFSGKSQCKWSSCREGCTADIYYCVQVRVQYSLVSFLYGNFAYWTLTWTQSYMSAVQPSLQELHLHWVFPEKIIGLLTFTLSFFQENPSASGVPAEKVAQQTCTIVFKLEFSMQKYHIKMEPMLKV